MISLFSSLFLAATAASAVLGAQTITVCSADAGQCLEGQSNITRLGAVLSASSSSYILLPGQYTSSIQPASLQQALGSATSTVTFTTGFSNSTTSTTPSLPLNVQLQPGLLNYPNDLYVGDPTFYNTPSNVNSTLNSTEIKRGSIIIAANTVAAIEANNGGTKTRVVLWDNVPYLSQLPYSMAGQLSLVSLQSTLCTPACSASAICISGTCQCRPGFTGESCESCEDDHFGPQCQPCPAGCKQCDEGITGTGACLTATTPSNAPSNCNCANGVCNGSSCTCSPGFRTASTGGNSTQCNDCDDGFFRTSSGNCEKCGSGCSICADTTGACTQCNSGLTNSNLQPQTCGVASQQCRPGQFASGTGCQQCNSACATCSGPSNTDCVTCAANTFFLSGQCVGIATVPASGVCSGSTLVANPLKGVCDTCPVGCSACQYDVFSTSSQFSDVKCSKCIPGKVLSDGKCIDNCPEGTFVGSDGFTCTACASSCGTCVNQADYCLTCKNNQLASAGTCVSNCPSNTFGANGACTQCHPDCATCSGAGFNQCLSCPSANPILTSSKRCVTSCSRSEYFDSSSASCKACDSSCGSCSGGGASACLSCNSSKQVLRAGACVNVDCGSGSGPTSGLGVCMAELVVPPSNTGPPATIPPLDPNAQQPVQTGGHKLTWWQILLIVLGALLLLLILLLLWRRYQRKKRAQQTEQFRENLKKQGLWRKLWRNPFAAWWARRKSAALARRSQDVERMSDAKGWAHSPRSEWRTNESTTDRRTAVGVPRSLSRGSWVTMGNQPNRRGSFDGRSYFSGPNLAGLGKIREDERYDYDDDGGRSKGAPSFRSFGRPHVPQDERSMYSAPMSNRFGDEIITIPRDAHARERGESQFYGQEIEQDDVRSERTYDPYQFPSSHSGSGSSQYRSHSHRDSRGSEDQSDLVSMIKSDYTEGDRYDDRYHNHQRSRTRDDRSYRGDYPHSVSTRSHGQSRRYRRDDREREQYSFGAAGMRMDSPSMYSQSTGYPHRNVPPQQVNGRLISIPPMKFEGETHQEPSLRDAVLSSRFSMSTAAQSTRVSKRKPVPIEPVPELKEPPRQLSDAEMYKMSKLFPELLALVSPTKKEKVQPPQQVIKTSPSRNPFRI